MTGERIATLAHHRRGPVRTEVGVRAPAKVNLQLSVGPLRDGYHELITIFHAVSLFDEVTVAPHEGLSVQVAGDPAVALDSVPTDANNLAARAARALAEVLQIRPDVRIRINKSIPVAGGMAGGSADAAAALLACHELWGAPLSRRQLTEIAAGLGSDVPFSLLGGTAVGSGRGQVLTPVRTSGRFHWVFGYARGGLSTPAIYAECDRRRAARGEDVRRLAGPARDLLAALATGDAEALGASLSNDLQSAALAVRPELARTLAVGRECGALGAIVSGSGPTCAFLARSRGHAVDLAAGLSASGVCASVAWAYGPVAGAASPKNARYRD